MVHLGSVQGLTQMQIKCWRWYCLFLLGVLAIAAFLPMPADIPFASLIMDALHVPAGALLMITMQLWLSRDIPKWCLVIFTTMLLSGLELLQPLLGRAAEWHDLLHGLLGLIFVLIWPFCHVWLRLITAALLTGIGASSLISVMLFRHHVTATLPELMVMPLAQGDYGWHEIPNTIIEWQPAAQKRVQLAVTLSANHWQGVAWHNPAVNLAGLAELCFTAKASSALSLQVRIDDAIATDYTSRFDSEVKLHPKWQRFCLDVSHLSDKRHRALDKSRLVSFYFFAKSPTKDGWFSLAQVSFEQHTRQQPINSVTSLEILRVTKMSG